jgi:hypothetical protein
MSKKHFIALADCVRANGNVFSDAAIVALADFCAAQNSNFKRERFLNYIAGTCGPCGGAVAARPASVRK